MPLCMRKGPMGDGWASSGLLARIMSLKKGLGKRRLMADGREIIRVRVQREKNRGAPSFTAEQLPARFCTLVSLRSSCRDGTSNASMLYMDILNTE